MTKFNCKTGDIVPLIYLWRFVLSLHIYKAVGTLCGRLVSMADELLQLWLNTIWPKMIIDGTIWNRFKVHVMIVCQLCDNLLLSFQKIVRENGEKITSGKLEQKVVCVSKTSFLCGLCPKSFTTRGNALRHLKNIHHKIRDRPCKFCGICFSRQDSRKDHEKKCKRRLF